MEVRIDVVSHEGELYCSAYFVMVARNLQKGSSLPVPKLSWDAETDPQQRSEAKLRFSMGSRRQEARRERLKKSLAKLPPEQDESKVIHDIFLAHMQRKEDGSLPPKKIVKLANTRVEKTELKHFQDRNTHGNIFGGVIMRECMELAFACANLNPWIKGKSIYFIDDIYFMKPIEVGSLIRYTAWLTYVEGHLAHVKVLVEKGVYGGEDVKYTKATEFNLVLKADQIDAVVEPRSYFEAVLYLEGKRRLNKLVHSN